MDQLHRIALWVGTVLLAAWGTGLILVPQRAHPLVSVDPMNPVTTGMMGAALVALAVVVLFMALNRGAGPVLEAALAFAILTLMGAYLMFVTGSALVNAPTVASLVIGGVAAIIMFIKAIPATTAKKK